MHARYAVALVVVLSAAGVRADLIELTDGRKVEGTLQRSGDVVTIKAADGRLLTVKPEQVSKVTLTGTLTPEEAANAEWTRLTGAVKAADDLQIVIGLYQAFLSKYPTARQAPDAQAAMSSFQLMAKNDPVKFRGRWMPRAQIEVVTRQWRDAAAPAVEHYKAGRMKEALEGVRLCLAADDQNPDALLIGGLAAYRTGNMPQAKTYFTALAAADPTSLLAENNIAVIASKQKQPGESLVHYARALQINPENRQVLDNMVAAFEAYLAASGDKAAIAYRTAMKAFEPAETRMEQQMAGKGLARWGGTWVTREQSAALTKYQDALRDTLAQLDAQDKKARDAIDYLNSQIKQAGADYDTYLMEFNTYNNLLVFQQTLPYDTALAVAQRDSAVANMDRVSRAKAQLTAQRDQYIAATRDFFAQLDKARKSLASVTLVNTGAQRILELGETETPPAPAAIPELPALPAVPAAPVLVVSPVPPAPVTVPVPVYVPVPVGR